MNEILRVESIVSSDNNPSVLVSYQKTRATLNITEARKLAFALIKAIAIAETEVAIIKKLSPVKIKRGFSTQSNKDLGILVGLIELIRSARPNKHPTITPIFGLKTQLPLIDYQILDERLQLQIPEASHHAQCLIECAEAAEEDAFIYKYFAEKIGLSRKEIEIFLLKFSEQRKVNYLESLF
ncbi:MAG: hypothetical protein ACRC1Z_07005 [Waterburya sp.]